MTEEAMTALAQSYIDQYREPTRVAVWRRCASCGAYFEDMQKERERKERADD